MNTIDLQKNQTIAFDGDSLTALRSPPVLDQWPWLRICNSHRSWADVFSELLFAWRPDLNLTFRTIAVGGSTCRELQARFEATVATIKPDWVFLTLGTNDAQRGIPLNEYEVTLSEYCARVTAWGGSVVFLYNIAPCPNASPDAEAKYTKRQAYDAVLTGLTRNCDHVHLIDIGTPLKAKAELLYAQHELHNIYSDGTHFSHLGAMIIAGEVLRTCGVVSQTPPPRDPIFFSSPPTSSGGTP